MTAPCPRKPSFVFLFPVCMLPLDSFIPTTVLYTLINKFFLFLRFFPRTRILSHPAVSLLSDYHDPFFALQSLSPYPVLFLTAITNSHRQSTLLGALQLLAYSAILFHSRAPSVLLVDLFRSWVNLAPTSPPFSHALALYHGHSVPVHVYVNKIPDKPPNLFAGNCPQILEGK